MSLQQHFGRYRLLKRIASGGMAEVYLARSALVPADRPPVVLKVMHPVFSSMPELQERFLQEARINSLLSHLNVVGILDFGRQDDRFFMVSEFVCGVTVADTIASVRQTGRLFPPEYAAQAIGQVCEGLHHAHNLKDDEGNLLNIIHLDLNPSNVMLGFDEVVKLLDFGIANIVHEQRPEEFGALVGTVAYMSPEQIRRDLIDLRSDIFSLGAVLYEFASGTPLFSHFQDKVSMINAITAGVVPPPSDTVKGFPEALEAVIMKALRVDPDERYQTAWEMKLDLDSFLATFEFDPLQEGFGSYLRGIHPEVWSEYEAICRGKRDSQALAVTPPPPGRQPVAPVMASASGPTRQPQTASVRELPDPKAPVPGADVLARRRTQRAEMEAETAAGTGSGNGLLVAAVALMVLLALLVGWRNLPRLKAAQLPEVEGSTEYVATAGKVLVISEPPKAQVSIDGVTREGFTPLLVSGLELETDHMITLEKAGYQLERVQVRLKPPRTLDVVHLELVRRDH